MLPPSTTLDLIDDLLALAGVRGDDTEQQRWQRLRQWLVHRPETATAAIEARTDSGVDSGPLLDLKQVREQGWVMREHAIAELPVDLRWLFEAGAVSLAQLEPLARTLGVVTLADLLSVVTHRRLGDAFALGSQVQDAISLALPTLRARVPRIPLGRALEISMPLLARLRSMPSVAWAEAAGSLRRGHDLVGDIDLVVCAAHADDVFDAVTSMPEIDRCAHRSRHRLVVAAGTTQAALRCLPAPAAAATLLRATGNREHLAQLHQAAAERRLTLTDAGLFTAEGHHVGGDTEASMYAALGLPFIPPELRQGHDEIARARTGRLPDLVERDDILGDLHMHTTWSDGRDSIEAMARAAADLGYRYIAITDHSPASAAARHVAAEDIGRQAEEIERAREQVPQLTILHGCEVDILPDGRLDFPDKTLRRFDFVIASLHDRAGHSSQQLLRRYFSAMVHPLVALITHPANRRFPRAPGYELDYDRLFEAAVETRTALEIDGAPSHIDLEATLAARAASMGVLLSIDSDAHAADHLARYMHAGLLTARHAAVERGQVLNARPLPEIRAIVARKRGRFAV